MTRVDWQRRDWWYCVVLAAAAAIAVVLAITPHPAGVFQDDGAYVILAKAIAQGDGYRFINLPNAPNATHYPPLYPIFLAALWKVSPPFPENVVVFKLANALFLGLAAALVYAFARRRLAFSMWAAAVTTAATVISAPVIALSTMVLSEAGFLAALVALLLYAERIADKPTPIAALALGAACGALGLWRTLGIFVVPALLIMLVIRRQVRSVPFLLIGAAALLAPWQLWTAAHVTELPAALSGKYGSYLGWFVDGVRDGGLPFVGAVIWINAKYCAGFIAQSFGVPADRSWLFAQGAVVIAVLSLLLIGFRSLQRLAPVTGAYLAIYLSVVLVWPFPPDRFLWGIWPLLGLVFALGVRQAGSFTRERPRWVWRVGVATTVTLIALYARPHHFGKPRVWVSDIQSAVTGRSLAVVEWVRTHASPQDVIATEDDGMVYLYTGRLAYSPGAFTPREYVEPQSVAFAAMALDSLIREYPARWVIPHSQMGVSASVALMRRQPPVLVMRHVLSLGAVFERAEGGGSAKP